MFTRHASAGPQLLKRAIAALTALFLLGSATESVWADGHCAHHAALPGDFTASPLNGPDAQTGASAHAGPVAHDNADANGSANSRAIAGAHGSAHDVADAHKVVHDFAGAHEAVQGVAGTHDAAGAGHTGEAHSCTCLSDCTITVAAVLLPDASTSAVPLVYSNVVRHEPTPRIARSAVLDLLPYAQAPPVL